MGDNEQRGLWLLIDNGGEFTIRKINTDIEGSTPYDADDLPSEATTALRAWKIINQQPIDWTETIDSELAEIYGKI
jgi:hypothetical protein